MTISPRSSGRTAFHLQASSRKGRMYIYNLTGVLSKDSSAGYVIADATGAEIVRVGLYLGTGLTNNECEAVAL